MNATKRAQVPFGLRKKLMAATSMLLVAAIMLVSTSYAWFTLSTAPEITGITTSVGANGNLEIALLNTETYNDTGLITSNTGDSMETQGKVAANITWGNLIDLSDTSYGLGNIKMYPSALNVKEGKVQVAPLNTPVYGADGRVTTLEATTATAVYNTDNGAFEAGATADFGVRAVGISSDISPRQLTFTSAKANFTQSAKSAQAATKSAVSTNATSLLVLATGGGSPSSYTYTQVEDMRAIAVGIQSSLNSIVSAYANAIIAAAAADTAAIDDAAIALLNATLSGMTSATSLKSALSSVTVSQAYTEDLTALEEAQAEVAASIAQADTLLTAHATGKTEITDSTEVSSVTNGIVKPLIGGVSGMTAYGKGEDANTVIPISGDIGTLATTIGSVYIGDGAVNTVALYTNTFKVTEAMGVTVYAGAKANTTGKLTAVTNSVNGLNPTFGTGTANITDFYGYIIDFAFRTNAANSNLLLQTEAANRVYSNAEGTDLATQGSGSVATFNFGDSGMTYAQGKNLLESFRVVFFDPAEGTVYGTAKFGELSADGEGVTSVTGKLQLMSSTTTTGKYTLGKDDYYVNSATLNSPIMYGNVEITKAQCGNPAETLDAAAYMNLAPATVDNGDGTYTLGQNAYTATEYKAADSRLMPDGSTVVYNADNCVDYKATITAEEYAALATTTVKADDVTTDSFTGGNTLTSLPQNTVKKVSMLVYLDGNNIDNAAVNAVGSSGSLDLNVQFASDANLVPMENSTLKNKTVTAEGGAGN